MRGQSLTNLLAMLKAECGVNPSTTSGDTRYTRLLNNTQYLLASEYDFPFLQRRFDVSITAGGRYFDLPTTLNTLREYKGFVYWNGLWREIDYGVGQEQYNSWDSDNSETADPIMRWREYGVSGETAQFEVWPMPVTATTLRFEGQKIPNILGDENNYTCDLDDLLLVYWVAAEELARLKQPDAQAKAARARERLVRVRAAAPSASPPVVFGRRPVKETRTLVGITSGAETKSGSSALEVDAASGSVLFTTAMRNTPTSVQLTVRAPVGGDNIFATLVAESLAVTGFDYTLSAAPSVSGYYLDYVAST